MSLLLSKKSGKAPVWLMRQAGRYLPEYMEMRKGVSNFLEFCYNSDLASEATRQPIDRFDFDLAIIFSDILVVPKALGVDVQFVKGEGPVLTGMPSELDLSQLTFVQDSIRKTKTKITKPLIGFSGSPATLLLYILEGSGSRDFNVAKEAIYKTDMLPVLEGITDAVIAYLELQIDAGCDVIKLFDSHAGHISSYLYDDFVIKPNKKISDYFKNKYPQIPQIFFPRGSGEKYYKFSASVGCDAIAFDQSCSLEMMQEISKTKIVQGNLDPVILLGDKFHIKHSVEKILNGVDNSKLIFNLGHGILPTTPIENVEYLLQIIRS
jgi:uroporphyrinogen decarboxylase